MRFKEIETKYRAKRKGKVVQLEEFLEVCRSIPGVTHESVPESYDHYYHNGGARNGRHRECKNDPQFTVKAKTTRKNNFCRREANVHLAPGVDHKDTIAETCSILGFKKKFSIFKVSNIVWYEKYNTVYYVVYSDSSKKKEIGRFMEIEMSEDYPWESEKDAWDLLLKIEKRLKPLGISPQRRVKESLYEMYRDG